MTNKIVSCVLVGSLCFSIGCYNAETVSKDELKAQTEQADITVFTKDSLEYKFIKNNYQLHGDTLSGFGVRKSTVSTEIVRDARLALEDVASIETRGFNLRSTILLCGAIGLGAVLTIAMFSRSGNRDTQVIAIGYVGPGN